jgi:predicted nucleotidyltransferase
MKIGQLDVALESIKSFCTKWKIVELSLFGSALREDFRADSDVDVLVAMQPGVTWGLRWFQMQRELESLLGRRIDLVAKRAIKNPFRRQEILTTRRIVYAA